MAAIYVEILIRAPMEKLWEFTQNPAIHEQWDLRFTSIEYLPRASENEPQKFRYATRIGFGLQINGDGESTGCRDLPGGERVSDLKFWSSEKLSLIREGAGFWKYVPTADGIRFFTRYDYRTRFGVAGKIIDRMFFRPLIGWATAWSFDSLRLWLERGIPPVATRIQAAVHALARIAVAVVFAWQGFAPKLFHVSADEVALMRAAGVAPSQFAGALTALGCAELIFAVALIVFWRRAWPAFLTIALMLVATLDVAFTSPGFLCAAFNPVSLNLSVAVLSAIDLLSLRNLATASTCLRTAPST